MSTTVTIDIELVTSAFKSALSSATKNADSFAKTAKSGFLDVQNSFETMAGVLAANALTSILRGISDAFGSMIGEAAESENAINNLNVSLQQAGLYSDKSSQDMQDFASSIQAVTTYGDEAVLASSSLLLSLTNLSTNGVQKATVAATNLAATLNIDLQSATDMITKAVNGNTTAFSKLGIQIQKGSTDAERLENTLAALAGQTGAAEAKTKTYAGAMAQLNNAKGEVLEVLGKLITQNPIFIASLNELANVLGNTATWLSDNKQFLEDLGKTVLITTGIVGALAAGFWAVKLALDAEALAAAAAWLVTLGPIALVVAGVAAVGVAVYAVVKYWDDLKAATYNAIAAVLEYSAIAAGLVSSGAAESLNKEAQAWRDKATATREAAEVTKETTAVDQEQADKRKAKLAEELAEIQRSNEEKAALAQEQADTLAAIELNKQLTFQEQQSAHEQAMLEIDGVASTTALEQRIAQQQVELQNRQAYEQELLQIQIAADLAKAQAIADSEARKKAIRAANDKAALEEAKLQSKQQIEVVKQRNAAEEQLAANRVANQRDTFSTIATLQNSNNRELAAIGKAAAITQIAIDTPVAISKALAAFPPPANFIAAGLVGVAMAAQAAQIAGVKFAQGGIVPGSNYSGDRVRASLNSGEMVLNKSQQANLFNMANQKVGLGSGDSTKIEGLLVNLIDAVKSSTSISIDGREIISVVRDGLADGRRLA